MEPRPTFESLHEEVDSIIATFEGVREIVQEIREKYPDEGGRLTLALEEYRDRLEYHVDASIEAAATGDLISQAEEAIYTLLDEDEVTPLISTGVLYVIEGADPPQFRMDPFAFSPDLVVNIESAGEAKIGGNNHPLSTVTLIGNDGTPEVHLVQGDANGLIALVAKLNHRK